MGAIIGRVGAVLLSTWGEGVYVAQVLIKTGQGFHLFDLCRCAVLGGDCTLQVVDFRGLGFLLIAFGAAQLPASCLSISRRYRRVRARAREVCAVCHTPLSDCTLYLWVLRRRATGQS